MASKSAAYLPRTVATWRSRAISVTTPSFTSSFDSSKRFLHEGPDTIDELIDRHIVKDKKKSNEEEDAIAAHRRITSSKREAMSLYRDIIRASRFFPWTDSRGVPWRDVLRANARKEFEEARYERDPEIITRLLIGGRDAVQAALDKLVEKHKNMTDGDRGGEENNGRGGR